MVLQLSQDDVDRIQILKDQKDSLEKEKCAIIIHGQLYNSKKKTGNAFRLTENAVKNLVFFRKGMIKAKPDEPFAFTFTKNKKGKILDTIKPLFQELVKYQKIRIGPHEYTLGGSKNSFIQRRFRVQGE